MTFVRHHPLVGQGPHSVDAATRHPRATIAAALPEGLEGTIAGATAARIERRETGAAMRDEVERVAGGVTAESGAPPLRARVEVLADGGGRSQVCARRDDDRVSIAGMGTGVEIAARDRARLYRLPEQRTLPSGERLPGGTGPGLARTKRRMAMHGETIDVESELGGGTAFTVGIPVA
jgi:hypothetical protein